MSINRSINTALIEKIVFSGMRLNPPRELDFIELISSNNK